METGCLPPLHPTISATGEKFSKLDNFYAFSRLKFEFISLNLDILPKNMQFDILSTFG